MSRVALAFMTQNGTVQPVFPSPIMPNQVYTPGSSALDIFVAPTVGDDFLGQQTQNRITGHALLLHQTLRLNRRAEPRNN